MNRSALLDEMAQFALENPSPHSNHAGYRKIQRHFGCSRSLAQQAARLAQDNGMREIDVFVKGPGPGREAAIRSLQAAGLVVRSITDVTPIPHNGCRPRKRRRV